MPKFPEPPAPGELARIAPASVRLQEGTLLWRLYFRGGRHPTFWNTFREHGPTRARFDHQLPPPGDAGEAASSGGNRERAILYAAQHGPTALAEVFQEIRVVDRVARDPWLVGFMLRRPLTLLDLSGTWPTRAGASMALSSGPRPRSQRWSRAIYQAYPEIEGLWYPSSMNANLPAAALYERAGDALPAAPAFHRALADPALLPVLGRVAFEIGYGLV